MWPALLSAALASPVVVHVSLREVGDDREQTIAWTVSDETLDAPPITWTSIDGRERRAIVAVWPLFDGLRWSVYAKMAVSERHGRRWEVLTSPSSLVAVDQDWSAPFLSHLKGVSPVEHRFSASFDGLPGPVPPARHGAGPGRVDGMGRGADGGAPGAGACVPPSARRSLWRCWSPHCSRRIQSTT